MRKYSADNSHCRNRPPRKINSRAFTITIICVSSLLLFSLATENLVNSRHENHPGALKTRKLEQIDVTLSTRLDEDCRLVHNADDKCAFVKANCRDEEAGLLSYTSFYYCSLSSVPIIAFVILTLWLALLFTTIGIAASDFFCINLSTIASIFGMSEGLAGTTLLAFGNGSPDVFSTFAAMKSHSGSLAVGELIGAASFITAVVAGSMALTREFKVGKKTFVRDVGFFILAASFTMIFLADGSLHLWECCVMVGLYLFYVIFVVFWHWFLGVRRNRIDRENLTRDQYLATPNEVVTTPENDAYYDDAPTGDRYRISPEDFNPLEQRPLSGHTNYDDDSDEEIQNEIRLAAEMASSMRVTRPKGSRRNTITPIRPSLIGALEFRSALSVVEKSRQFNSRQIHLRQYSENAIETDQYTDDNFDFLAPNIKPSSIASSTKKAASSSQEIINPSAKRPASITNSDISKNDIASATSISAKESRPAVETRVGRSMTLSLPISSSNYHRKTSSTHSSDRRRRAKSKSPAFSSGYFPKMPSQGSPNLWLKIPSPTDNPHLCLSPFPQIPIYVDSPDGSSSQNIKSTSPVLSHVKLDSENGHDEQVLSCYEKLGNWWPHRYFPSPNILFNALFPTLTSWREKSVLDKFIGVISAPSIFLLAITLPVVELESSEDNQTENRPVESFLESNVSSRRPSRRGLPSILTPDGHSVEIEPEWLASRQFAANRSCLPPNLPQSPHPHSPTLAPAEELPHNSHPIVFVPDRNIPSGDQNEEVGLESVPLEDWNRWLVSIQIFTAPIFMVIIFWANTDGDDTRLLIKMILYSLSASLIIYSALIMSTSPTEIPRYRFLLSFLGFIVSIFWISTIANEVVGVLKTLGVILGISDAILGLTIFAVGNSLGDLVADITVARLGFPVMALSACFGGPILNILLGIGLSGTYITINDANKRYAENPESHFRYEPYHINVSDTLVISALTLFITLVGLLIAVPLNRWIMGKKIGWGLIIVWSVSTLLNLGVEVNGVLKESKTAMGLLN